MWTMYWRQAISQDARKAYRSLVILEQQGNKAVDVVREHYGPLMRTHATPVDPQALIKDLKADDYAIRRKAYESPIHYNS